jgi:hypothetical protein
MTQRSRSYHDPLDLGLYDRTSIRYIKGRIGAENKGQTAFRCTNDGASNAFQNVWFKVTITDPGYLIFLKDDNRDKRFYSVNVYTADSERRQLAYPMLTGDVCRKFDNMVAGFSSDLYNISDQRPELRDRNRTSLFPLPKGSYVINISTQRWDMFRYGVYMILEMPTQTGYLELETETNSMREFALQEATTQNVPKFFLLEDAVVGVLQPVRERSDHDERELRGAWRESFKDVPFPKEIQDYIRATQVPASACFN